MIKYISESIVRKFNAVFLTVITCALVTFALVIGVYNFNRTSQDLQEKSNNTLALSRIALASPLFYIDLDALDEVVRIILQDEDIVAIRVNSEGEEVIAIKRGSAKEMSMADLEKNRDFIVGKAGIVQKDNYEDKNIGEVTIITSTQKTYELISIISVTIGFFTLILIGFLGALVVSTMSKFIKKPIDTLIRSADQLARGNLTEDIDTSQIDELGSLAKSFSDMRDSIRDKISDLHVLNTTGEVLAGLHDQTEALETSLRIMQARTKITHGSTYLLNSNKALKLSAFSPEYDHSNHPKSFLVGEGIAGKAAAEGKVIYVPDTSNEPEYVSQGEEDKKQALLCIPMMDNQNVFGVMNFSGEVGETLFDEDDEEFALTIARMTVVATKNIQMLNVIEEQNRTLEQRVASRTRELNQKTHDINSMLHNMHQGIFTILEDGSVHPEYSTFLEKILETNQIAGRNAIDLLFSHTAIGSDTINQITVAVGAIIGEDPLMFQFNEHLLITEFQKTIHGCTKILELDWDPIHSEEDLVEKIMVTVRDVTSLRGLQAEAETQKRELEILGQIMAITRNNFEVFVETSHDYLEENRQLIEKNTKYEAISDLDDNIVQAMFRNMHTIKGNARVHGFKGLCDVIHEAEETLVALRQKAIYWDTQALQNGLEKVDVAINEYNKVYQEKLASFFKSSGGVRIESQLMKKIAEELEKNNSNLVDAIGSEPVCQVLSDITESLTVMAQELGKPVPVVTIKDNGIRIRESIVLVLKDVFMHLLRNAMDHGIEMPEDRTRIGKPAQGRIEIEVDLEDDTLSVRTHDDGRGLFLKEIREKAIERGAVDAEEKLSDQEVAQLIFHSGLSTASKVGCYSGRGVGMDAIRRFLQRQNGDIAIQFENDAIEVPGYVSVAFVITLPGEHACRI